MLPTSSSSTNSTRICGTGTKDVLLIDNYLFTKYSFCKMMDETLLIRKEQWLRCVSLSRKAAVNAPTNPTNNNNLIHATLDNYLISRIHAFNDGFLLVGNN